MDSVRIRRSAARLAVLAAIAGGACPAAARASSSRENPSSIVEPNDNTRRAGTLDSGTLTLALYAGAGQWKPEGPSGPALQVEAFGDR
jgi:hypothetical protein